jgi:hypothetical protein
MYTNGSPKNFDLEPRICRSTRPTIITWSPTCTLLASSHWHSSLKIPPATTSCDAWPLPLEQTMELSSCLLYLLAVSTDHIGVSANLPELTMASCVEDGSLILNETKGSGRKETVLKDDTRRPVGAPCGEYAVTTVRW